MRKLDWQIRQEMVQKERMYSRAIVFLKYFSAIMAFGLVFGWVVDFFII